VALSVSFRSHVFFDLLQQAIDGLGDRLLHLRRDGFQVLLPLVPALREELLGLLLRSLRFFEGTALRRRAGLPLQRGERLAQGGLAVPHQALELLDELLEGVLHLLGEHVVGGLGLLDTVFGVLLRLLELRLRFLAALLRRLPVALRSQVQRFLALRDPVLPLGPGLLTALDGLLRGFVKLLELLEPLLVLVVPGLDLVVDLLRLLVGFLRLRGELADLRLHRLDELRQR